jgi:hypothetical protein
VIATVSNIHGAPLGALRGLTGYARGGTGHIEPIRARLGIADDFLDRRRTLASCRYERPVRAGSQVLPIAGNYR